MRLGKKYRLEWTKTLYGDNTVLSSSVRVTDRYSVSVRLSSKVYENSYRGTIFLEEVHWSDYLSEWITDSKYDIGYITLSVNKELSLREAKSVAEFHVKKIVKNILKNSFTE